MLTLASTLKGVLLAGTNGCQLDYEDRTRTGTSCCYIACSHPRTTSEAKQPLKLGNISCINKLNFSTTKVCRTINFCFFNRKRILY
jgi:hypothetical protein